MARESAAIVGGRVVPVWLEDGDRFLYAENGAGDLTAILVDPAKGSTQRLCSDRQVRTALAAAAGGAPADPAASISGLAADGRGVYFTVADHSFIVERDCRTARAAPEREAAIRRGEPRLISRQFPTTFGDLVEARSPDGRRFVTVRDHNLQLRRSGEDDLVPLTTDGSERLTWQNTQESAQSFNVYWAPDSRHFAAVQLDTTKVWYEPLPHWLGPHPETEYVAYPRAGEPMHGFRLAIFDAETRQRVAIDTGDTTDHYVDLLGWRGDGRAIYYQVTDREQKSVAVVSADASTGMATVVLRESRGTYIDTPMTLGIQFVLPLQRANGFVRLTDADGWRHLYLHDETGRLVRRLTTGHWPVERVVTIDERAGYVYFLASQDPSAPYDLQLYRVGLRGRPPERLTAGAGVHDISMAPSGRWFVDERSSPSSPPVIELRAANGRLIKVLSSADIGGLVALGYSGIDRVVTKSVDGRFDMHGVVIRPFHFDPARKYPVVEIIYGGMQSINTPYRFYPAMSAESSPLLRCLVREGFVVVVMDAPGTPGRGRAFQDVTYGIWPQTVIANHVQWIRAAASTRPWMDLDRVGVYGHSWGAYMAERAMIDAPHFYKAAAAHAGPADLVDHPTYIEPFMGLPAHNPRGYEAGSNLTRVAAIEGPVLVMPAPLDVNAGFTPGMKFVEAMIRAKKDVDLAIFPDSSHRLNCCGRDRELYGVAVIQRFLQAHLADDRRNGQ